MGKGKLAALSVAVALAAGQGALASDLGVSGTTFAIGERDILEFIAAQLAKAKSLGRLPELQRQFTARVKKRVERPRPVDGLVATSAPRSWLFDPSIIVPQDFKHPDGRVFAKAGDRLNPLDRLPGFDRVMIFVDGDDPAQVEFGFRKLQQVGIQRGRLILTNGAPLELMRKRKVQVYFDQEGRLTGHFGVRQVPAIIEREGSKLRISEVKP